MTSHYTTLAQGPLSVGLAADHAGFEIKSFLSKRLRSDGHRVTDFGDKTPLPEDDYTDFIVPLARAVANGTVQRGIGVCGSGVGVSIAANKIRGVRACLVHETFSAHQGVEDDDMNMLCLGGLVVGRSAAWELVQAFLGARFSGEERHRRRLAKILELEGPLPGGSP